MNRKRILAILLSGMTLLSVAVIPVLAEDDNTEWSPAEEQSEENGESGEDDSDSQWEYYEEWMPVVTPSPTPSPSPSPSPTPEVPKTQLHIYTVQDLKRLAENCRLDTYSDNLEVFLDCSLDLSGTSFTAIPHFNGSFDGKGNRITGLSFKASGESRGLFSRIDQNGVVMNLCVEGRITSAEDAVRTGGIAGSNYGILLNCSFQGSIAGQEETGGICGYNEGFLLNCYNEGSISGVNKTGGLCGCNAGNIVGCTNRGDINIAVHEKETKTTEINALSLLGLVTADNVNTTIDTGGVVGYSEHILLRCENYGNVGYPTYGYNIGGIAGRSSNCISKCFNYGLIYGRNDVGGIAGQAEPYMLLEDRQTLADEIRAFSEAFNKAMENLGENGAITAQYVMAAGANLDEMGQLYNDTASNAGYYDELEREAGTANVDLNVENGDIFQTSVGSDEFYNYEALIDNGLFTTSEVSGNITGDQVRQIISTAQENGDKQEDITKTVTQSGDIVGYDLGNAANVYNNAMTEGGIAVEAEKAKRLAEGVDRVTDINLDQSAIDAVKTGDYETVIKTSGSEGPEAVYNSADWISTQRANRKESGAQSSKAVKEGAIEIHKETDSLEDNIAGIGSSVAHGALDLEKDMEDYNEHMTNALTMMANAMSGQLGTNLYNDISELNGNGAESGKITKCVNYSAVEGETNVGGIAGNMAIESEYDLEGVISDTMASEGIFSNTYKVTCVLESNVNRGEVRATKSNCGGIAGNQALGYACLDESYGDVKAEDDYAGGVVGKSESIINTCYSSCDVTAASYAGGIAGKGTVILDCISLSSIPETVTTFRGAIAGCADVKATRVVDSETGILAKTVETLLPALLGDEEAEELLSTVERECVLGNYFVSSTLGGINGISYRGVAEPVSYETVMSYEGLPENLKTRTVYFRADGVTVAEVQIPYGYTLTGQDIPQVPEKEGYSGVWKDFDVTTVQGGIVEAEYLPQLTIVESSVTRGATGVSAILLTGQFPAETEVLTLRESVSMIRGSTVFEAWSVAPDGGDEEQAYKVRYQVPDAVGDRFRLYVYHNGKWEKTAYTTVGSYIEFDGAGDTTTFAVTQGVSTDFIVKLCLLSALFSGIVTVIITIARREERHE